MKTNTPLEDLTATELILNLETLTERLDVYRRQSGFFEIKEYMAANYRRHVALLRAKGFRDMADYYMEEWDK